MRNRINRLKKTPLQYNRRILCKRTVRCKEVIGSGHTEINNNADVEILTDKSVSIPQVVHANYVLDGRHRTLTEKQNIDLRNSRVAILMKKKTQTLKMIYFYQTNTVHG